MARTFEGSLVAKGLKFVLIVSRFNDFISRQLLESALDAIKRHQGAEENIDIAWVPGSFEIPLVAQRLAETRRYDALICLGVILRGATPHFEYIASEAAKGIAAVSLNKDIPVAFGIITADTLDQAIERAGAKAGNKGWQAAVSAIEMVNLLKSIK